MADIIGRGEADREQVGVGAAAELHLVDQTRGERERIAVEFGRRAERSLIAGRARQPAGADRLAATLDRRSLAPCVWQKGVASSGGAGRRETAAASAFTLATTVAGPARPSRSVANFLPSQYQRWSALWPPIITAARSLPATATLRLPGHRCFISSPSVGTRR